MITKAAAMRALVKRGLSITAFIARYGDCACYRIPDVVDFVSLSRSKAQS